LGFARNDKVSEFRLRLLNSVSGLSGVHSAANLAFENRRRILRDELEIFEHEFRIHAVAGWFVDGVSAEAPIKFVFEIVVRAKFPLGAIWREFLFLIEHDQ